MNMKRFAGVMTALCLCAVTGCGSEIQTGEKMVTPDVTQIVTTTADTIIMQDIEEEEVAINSYDSVTITGKETTYTKYSKTYQAETGTLSGKATVKKTRKDYSGKGYVTSISTQDDWAITFDLPSTQYYNISISIGADEIAKNGIAVNGEKISEFSTDGTGKFEVISFNNIYLQEGINKISIVPENGVLDVDYIKVVASKDIVNLSQQLKNPTLSNKNSDYRVQALFNYLCENYGKSVILGQYDTIGTTVETQLIYQTTGKYPAIRFGDMMLATEDSSMTAESEYQSALDWDSAGGITGYMWHWTAPLNHDGYYVEDTDFDLSKAVTKQDIATMDIADIKKLEKEGKVSPECVAIVEDIDKVSQRLSMLQDEGIAVLWRPLHEASNASFWWGKDKDSYLWLWKLMYTRQTSYSKLNNLIWVWSAQNKDWYVGDKYCDVLSVDVYDDGNKDGQVNWLLFLQGISANKPIAMSECGNFPSIQSIADEKAMWSYIGQWGGNFLLTEDGSLSEEYNTTAELITMYNNNLTITREMLPDFTHLANEIKEEEENSSTAEDDTSSKTVDENAKTESSADKKQTTTKSE